MDLKLKDDKTKYMVVSKVAICSKQNAGGKYSLLCGTTTT